MENNITSEEFIISKEIKQLRDQFSQISFLKADAEMLKAFAKLKCQEQLQAILENVKIKIEWEGTPGLTSYKTIVDKDSIINAYDLNNIK